MEIDTEAGPSGQPQLDTAAATSEPADAAVRLLAKSPAGRVVLSDDDPFDLDAYIQHYQGRRRIERLLFVARRSPTLHEKALKLALQAVEQSSLDYKLYLAILKECPQAEGSQGSAASHTGGSEEWAENARVKQESGMEKLDVELKNYQNNLIKESIRMGFRDIGDFQRKSGDLAGAIRSYGKSREFCTTSQHILDMCLSVVDTALDQCSYATVRAHVMKAEHALSSVTGSAKSVETAASRGVNLPGMLAANQPGRREEEARTRQLQFLGEKLTVANAVASLGQSDYKGAARGLLNISSPQSGSIAAVSSSRESTSTNTAHYISNADIGLYGVLCGMATLTRPEFKRLVLENAEFRPYLEHNSFLKDVMLQYYTSKFQSAIHILEKNMSRMLLDIHLFKHVAHLVGRIKDKMVELYFEPFKAVKLDKMAVSLGWDSKMLEHELVRLIQNGTLKARINTMTKTLVAHTPDERATLFDHTLRTVNDNDATARAMAWRMKLIQADIIVDAKKDSTPQHNGQQQQGNHQKGGGQKGGNTKKSDKHATSRSVDMRNSHTA